jgi:hypothetical protein
MKDNYGDTIEIVSDGVHIFVTFRTKVETETHHLDMALTPKKARKLANLLTITAREIDS